MGSSSESLTVLEELDEHKYVVEAPTPHPSFETYAVQATPSYGVVWVKGIGRTFANDAHGSMVQNEYERLQRQFDAPVRERRSR